MSISIRDPRAADLARKLATRRKTTMTAAIIHALEAELEREERRDRRPLAERVREIADRVKAMSGPNGRVMTKEEIDEMWTG